MDFHRYRRFGEVGVRLVPALLPTDAWHGWTKLAALDVSGVGAWLMPGLRAGEALLGLLTVVSVSLIALGASLLLRRRWRPVREAGVSREAHERLRAALARAEKAIAMRDRLITNVSHELRSPLNVIVGYSDMLLEATEDSPGLVAHVAPRIRDYAVSLEHVVGELLNLSRLTSADMRLTITDIDVPALLDEVARGARALLGTRPVEVVVECEVARFRSDRARVRQILGNLAANAVKFTTEGRIVVTARVQRDGVGFYVSDTGCGIPAGKHTAIFSPFEQVTPDGLGLGLAIVRQATDLLGGTVALTSAPGVGSSFAVTLPHSANGVDREPVAAPRAALVLSKSHASRASESAAAVVIQPLVGCVDIERNEAPGTPNRQRAPRAEAPFPVDA